MRQRRLFVLFKQADLLSLFQGVECEAIFILAMVVILAGVLVECVLVPGLAVASFSIILVQIVVGVSWSIDVGPIA